MLVLSASTDSGHAHSNMLRCNFDTRDLIVWKRNRRKVHKADIRSADTLEVKTLLVAVEQARKGTLFDPVPIANDHLNIGTAKFSRDLKTCSAWPCQTAVRRGGISAQEF